MHKKDEILKTYKVLVVEDEDKIRKYVAKPLRYMVDEVQEASNGQEALDILETFDPDIIMTDIEMPIMNGIDLIKNIRKTNKKVSIIVLTAFDNKEYLHSLIDMRLDQYLIKPINFDKLLSALYGCQESIDSTHNIEQSLPFGYTYVANQKSLFYKDEAIKLSKKESAFLELLIKYKNRIVKYQEFQNYIWKDDYMSDSALKSVVKNIRKKLPKDLVVNLSGIGYKLV